MHKHMKIRILSRHIFIERQTESPRAKSRSILQPVSCGKRSTLMNCHTEIPLRSQILQQSKNYTIVSRKYTQIEGAKGKDQERTAKITKFEQSKLFPNIDEFPILEDFQAGYTAILSRVKQEQVPPKEEKIRMRMVVKEGLMRGGLLVRIYKFIKLWSHKLRKLTRSSRKNRLKQRQKLNRQSYPKRKS